MQILEPLHVPNPRDLTLAKITGDYEGTIERFCFSTKETQGIVNRPELMGIEYTEALETAMVKLLTGAKTMLSYTSEHNANVLVFLRGGINFGLREALARAYGWNTHGVSYLSSQRARDAQGRWYIQEDSYKKITARKGTDVFCSDIIATGVTLHHGLREFTRMVKERGGSIRSFSFFTIGCHKAEKVLEEYQSLWKSLWPDFQGICLFYAEGKFHLADSKTPVQIKLQGTDLLRRNSLLMPAFIAAQEANVTYALERCTIYDAGSRAFNIEEYLCDVRAYWQEVSTLAKNGITAEQYLLERFPEASEKLRKQAQKRSLEEICKERLETLSMI
jgi:hypothetical protein